MGPLEEDCRDVADLVQVVQVVYDDESQRRDISGCQGEPIERLRAIMAALSGS